MIIRLPPLFDNNLRFLPVGEEPPIQAFRPKCPFEALDKRILPRATWFDVQRVAMLLTQPLL